MITTLAGAIDGFTTGSADNSVGTLATFTMPSGITTDGTYLYVSDSGNNTIRQINIKSTAVTTLAGSADPLTGRGNVDGTGWVNGIAGTARFDGPYGITTDGKNLYVADIGNGKIRQINITTKEVTTLAGTIRGVTWDGTGGPIGTAQFRYPWRLSTDGTSLYVADIDNVVRQVDIKTGNVTTLAGSRIGYKFSEAGWTDGIGPLANFNEPSGITNTGSAVYVVDSMNSTIRQIK